MSGKSLYYKLVGITTRPNYWSCSAFSRYVQERTGVSTKPTAATGENWDKWQKENEKRFGYWFTEEILDHIQDVVYFPMDVFKNIRRYLRNRFIDKTHMIDTKLHRGEWHEIDHKLIHGMFETIVNFVEYEKAERMYISEIWEMSEKEDISTTAARKKVKKNVPSREQGLKYLDWEISLKEESPFQSAAAQEVKELYLWWKDVRPNRPDPMDVSGWSEYCDNQRDEGKMRFFSREDTTEEERKMVTNLLDKTNEIENQQYDEDTEMMVRLIKIRRSLWT